MAWLALAAQRSKGTDFDWLLKQLKQPQFTSIWAQLYNAMDLWLAWDLTGARFSKSANTFPVKEVHTRQRGMRMPPASVKAEIQRPIDSVARLDRNAGTKLIDVAMASLAVRHRETYHFNHANPREVYLTDAGDGVSIAIFGLQNSYRFPARVHDGLPDSRKRCADRLRRSPVSCSGKSIPAANIFSEYRGSEAAFLWVQVMRAYHHVTGCTRFIANPYQFGSENDEALKSGAFWFYYRLGYRPVMQDVRTLARREFAKIRRNRKHRSDLKTLRRLASCDMHLTLPGARQSDLFDEQWIETSSMLATRALSAAGGRTWKTAANRVTGTLARDLGLHNLDKWSAPERMGLKRIAPIAVAAHPGDWTVEERRDMRKLLRAKGGEFEARYARMMSRHERFLAALRKACRRADSIT